MAYHYSNCSSAGRILTGIFQMTITITVQNDATSVHIESLVPMESVPEYLQKAIDALQKELDGFRKYHTL